MSTSRTTLKRSDRMEALLRQFFDDGAIHPGALACDEERIAVLLAADRHRGADARKDFLALSFDLQCWVVDRRYLRIPEAISPNPGLQLEGPAELTKDQSVRRLTSMLLWNIAQRSGHTA